MKRLPDDVADLLACPRCHGALATTDSGLRCEACRVVYPVEDGVPVLLVDAAQPVEEAES